MANRDEVLKEINNHKSNGQDNVRRQYLKALYDYTKNDTIIYFSAFPVKRAGIPSSVLSINLDDIQGFMTCINGLKGKNLDLVLHSPGGSLYNAREKLDHILGQNKV